MELIFPALKYKEAAEDYRQEHIDYGEKWIHGSSGFMEADSYENWLKKIILNQTSSALDWVTGSVYFTFVDNRIVGTVAVRHFLNDSLLKSGGHIGYGIRPSERRKGYGAQMLALALEKCREFGGLKKRSSHVTGAMSRPQKPHCAMVAYLKMKLPRMTAI